MANNSESVIDLTECSFTLVNHNRLDNVIINLDTEDSFREDNVGTVSRASKRRKRRHSRLRADNHPETSILDLCTPDVKQKKSTKSKNKTGKVATPDNTTDQIPDKIPRQTLGCPICFEEFSGQALASTNCGHVFCLECLKLALKSKPQCPTCRTSLRGKTKYHPLFL